MTHEPAESGLGPGQEPWQWSEPTWREHVARVRAGDSLTPAQWPDQARVAVAISFDSDHETIPYATARRAQGSCHRASTARASQFPKFSASFGTTTRLPPSICLPSPHCFTWARR